MKNLFFTFLFLFMAQLSFSQEQTGESKNNLKYMDKKEVKSANRVIVYSNQDNGQPISNDQKAEPVVIQYLKYDANENSSVNNIEVTADSVKVEEKSTGEPVRTIDNEITEVENNIKAIDSKVEWVKSNPKEHQNALGSGWYEQMESYKNAYLEKKQQLINSRK